MTPLALLSAFPRVGPGVAKVLMPALLAGVAALSLPALAAEAGQPGKAVKAPASHGASAPAAGQKAWVQVDQAWIRATVHGQSGTGGYMDLKASQDLSLVGFSAPVARESELHEMAMGEGDVMRMRAVDSLALPAGQTVGLRPGMGGHHLMLMGLKRQLKAGDKVALTLRLRTADGQQVTQTVMVPVTQDAPQGRSSDMQDMQGMHEMPH